MDEINAKRKSKNEKRIDRGECDVGDGVLDVPPNGTPLT